jgi:DNA repair protein RadC
MKARPRSRARIIVTVRDEHDPIWEALTRRHSMEDAPKGKNLLNEPSLVKDYLRKAEGSGSQERTGALYLNARNRLIRDEPGIFRGTLDRAMVEPREILKRGLLCDAAGIIVYHTHPSGDPSPSREDREFTKRLASAADLVGLRLLDHVVVGQEGCVSFRESGLMWPASGKAVR